eukprot:GFYU01008236.1.p1 GENE.GFYU01008236.1~~GFYU01008236.1.p1  ORF type:complete len:142 (-),score=28.81 GFYU01008236.1:347-772(-)
MLASQMPHSDHMNAPPNYMNAPTSYMNAPPTSVMNTSMPLPPPYPNESQQSWLSRVAQLQAQLQAPQVPPGYQMMGPVPYPNASMSMPYGGPAPPQFMVPPPHVMQPYGVGMPSMYGAGMPFASMPMFYGQQQPLPPRGPP